MDAPRVRVRINRNPAPAPAAPARRTRGPDKKPRKRRASKPRVVRAKRAPSAFNLEVKAYMQENPGVRLPAASRAVSAARRGAVVEGY